MSVMKVIELMSDSDKSWEEATSNGIKKASETIKGIQSAWVQDQSVTVENGKVHKYRVKLRVTFRVD